jgi:hypothetical protein
MRISVSLSAKIMKYERPSNGSLFGSEVYSCRHIPPHHRLPIFSLPLFFRFLCRGKQPYADIRFVVLHRPYIETIASHADHDGNAEQHSNVLRGFMLLIRRFLDAHANDTLAPGGRRRRTWTLVCVERLMSSYYGGDETARDDARRRITAHLANFLGWDHALEECNDCFDGWVESNKDHVGVLGGDNIGVLLEHMRKLGGIWPPEVEDALPEQKCSL